MEAKGPEARMSRKVRRSIDREELMGGREREAPVGGDKKWLYVARFATHVFECVTFYNIYSSSTCTCSSTQG